jgi:signal recognition particle receptor subunit beta
MASINYAAREISVKIVYYGPGLSGKTTNLQIIHRKVPQNFKSDMVSLATETDRTLFFDFLPLDLGKIKGFSAKFQLYTVPGQVYYNATRKLVLRGVDGIVFVADSAADKMDENLESFRNMEDNLAEYGYKRESIPIILQYNKRDLPNALPIDTLNQTLNTYNLPWSEASAVKGKGVFESLKLIGKTVIDELNKKYSRQPQRSARPAPAAAPVQPRPAQAAPPPPPPPPPQQPPQQPRQPAPRPMAERETQQFPQSEQWRPSPQSAPQPQQPRQPRQPRQPQPPPAQPRQNGYEQYAQPQPRHQADDDYSDYDTIDLEPMSGQQPDYAAPNPYPASPAANKSELDLEIERYQQEIRTAHPGSPNQEQGYQNYAQPNQPQYDQSGYQTQEYYNQQQQQYYPDQSRHSFDSDQAQGYDYGYDGQPNQYANDYNDDQDEATFEIQPPSGGGYGDSGNQSYGQPDYSGYQDQNQQYGYQQPPGAGDGRAWGEQPPQNADDDQPMYFTSVNTDKQRKKAKRPVNPKNKPKKGLFGKFFNKEDEF